jgi:glycosyltransferase involved in cell wall biosynthesis
VIIPCFNEAATIGALVEAARPHVLAVWVADDGSSDTTRMAAERAGAVVRRSETNLGKGAALRDGLGALRAAGFEWALTLDGDGQHDAAEIPKFLAQIAAENLGNAKGVDLVIGNRMPEAGLMSGVRRVVNRWMSRKISARLGLDCPDSQCGFRLVRLEAWAQLQSRIRANHYEVESEMLTEFARAGFKIAFVPVRVLHAPRPSRIRPVTDSMRWFAWWLGFNRT